MNQKIAFVFNRQRSKDLEEAEFDTPEVIDAISSAVSKKYTVVQVEMDRNGLWLQKLESENPDLVLNTAEGFRGIGRESLAPICFEQMNLHYAGPGPYQCFLTLDKYLTKQVVSSQGVLTPESTLIQDISDIDRVTDDLIFPVFAKPNFEGSSKGITGDSLCRDAAALLKYLKKNLPIFEEGILVERYVNGIDLTVPYLEGLGEDGVLEPVEYFRPGIHDSWIYDYDLKNVDDAQVQVRCPAQVEPEILKLVTQQMKRVVRALSIQDMARADFRVTPSGEVFFIEINALPSLQPGAGIFEASQRLGLDYDQTIQHIVATALKRKKTLASTKVPKKVRFRKPNVSLVFNVKHKKPGEEGYEEESEFDSPKTIEAIGKAIEANGFPLEYVEMSRDLAQELERRKTDIVFNIAEGFSHRTREAQVPAICDLLGIEHTGSDATCLAITLDKSTTNKIIASEGILVPRSKLIFKVSSIKSLDLRYPVIAKPNTEGTSKGIYEDSVARNAEELARVLEKLSSVLPSGVLCEEYIEGREFTVGLLGGGSPKILGPSEIIFKKTDNRLPVYSFEAKQEPDPLDNDFFRIECPASLSDTQLRKVKVFARKAFAAAGCRDVGRIDFRMTAENEIYFIEVNPLPGLSPGYSDLAIIADKIGMSYNDLIGGILKPAVRRWRRQVPARVGAAL